MAELSTTKDKKADERNPSILNYIIGVSLSIVLIIGISQFVFNLVPKRSEFVDTEKVANETYKQYSQRLDAISKIYAKELEAINKEN
jgi:hypothetical protein